MSSKRVVANITWLVGAVSTYRGRLSLGYCCKGQGVFKIIPTGKRAGWYNLYPFLVTEVLEENGECEFAKSCFIFSCPLNKATYENIAVEYRVTIEEARRLVDRVRLFLEKILELDPEIKNKLCRDGYNLVYKRAPILLRRLRR